MTPFEQWFSSDWVKALNDLPDDREVLSSGFTIQSASWDRKAAYLLWVERGRPAAAWVQQMREARLRTPTAGKDLLDLDDLLTPPAPAADDLADLLA